MNLNIPKKLPFVLIFVFICLPLVGCQKTAKNTDSESDIEKPEVINATIGSIADIYQSGITRVRGFGIVAGLNGTGSSECPSDLRNKLISEIKAEMHEVKGFSPEAFLNSRNTAVVEIRGTIPPVASKGDAFDIQIAPLSTTQTTSLEGGRLFPAKLVKHEEIIIFSRHLRPLAVAAGPIFINKLEDRNTGFSKNHIIAGGRAIEGISATMILRKPNYYTARLITDLINDKFGIGTAEGKTKGQIQINIPRKYRFEKQKFLAMIRLIYLTNDPNLKQKRIDSLVTALAENKDKLTPELALGVIGKPVIDEIAPLLKHPNELVRFHAARCLINIEDNTPALNVLQNVIHDKNSPLRIPAVKAIGRSAKRNVALTILNDVLDSPDFDVQLAAYDEMRKLSDISVNRNVIANDFFLDTVVCRGERRIYASRKGTPKIVIFGEPVESAKNLFVQTDDENITINAARGDNSVLIWRKNPKKNGVIKLNSTFKVRDIVKTLGELPVVSTKSGKRPGLAIPYYQICAILEKMCRNNAIDAKFIAGDLPEFYYDQPKPQPQTIPDIIQPSPEPQSEPEFKVKPKNQNAEDQNIKNSAADEWKELLKEEPEEETNLYNPQEWRNLLDE